MPAPRHRSRRLTLGTAILIGMGAGILCGLLFGDGCAAFAPFGQAFIGLLQMTVLPYIMVALIAHIGSLTMTRARRLAGRFMLVLLLFWVTGLALLLVMPLALPKLTTASFFSASLIEHPPEIDYLRLFIPSNPFNAMANSLVPAVVLFSLVVGIAVIGLPDKERLIDPLRVLLDALMRVNMFVVKLTPAGVFAIAASAAGTLTPAELGRLQAYVISYVATAGIMSFCLLPLLVSALTGYRYRDVMHASRAALIMAFATNSTFVVLPLLVQAAKSLEAQRSEPDKAFGDSVDVLLPVAYSFPHMGKLLTMLFVPFGAWFTGDPLTLGRYSTAMLSGLLSYFGDVSVAMPFLLDLTRLPADLFNLFMLSGIFIGRFGSMTAAMSLLAVTLVTSSAVAGRFTLRPRRAGLALGTTAALVLVTIVAERAYLSRAMAGAYDKDTILAQMQLLTDPVDFTIEPAGPNPDALGPGETRLERIDRRRKIRIGIVMSRLPWAYSNVDGMLVGFDVELAHDLARSMDIAIEFVPVADTDRIEMGLEQDWFDVAWCGIVGSVSMYERVLMTEPYFQLTPALIVPDYRRHQLETVKQVRAKAGLRVGVDTTDRYLRERIQQFLPRAEIVPVSGMVDFFEGNPEHLDALVSSAEAGSAWTILYPRFTVVLSLTDPIEWPVHVAVAGHDQELAAFLDLWIDLNTRDGTVHDAYERWIEGRPHRDRPRRWSILHDVLHWL